MERKSVDFESLSPMMKEYYKTKDEYEDVLLFYRLGDFYELFFEDAEIASHELELTLTGKNAGLKERIPMCGVPHHAVSIYIEKLIDKGYKVAICEQMEDPKLAKGIVKREVIQVVSKGTLTNTESINEKDFNYIASITDLKYIYVLSYIDLLSGKNYGTFISYDTDKLISYLVNLNIKEVVVKDDFNHDITKLLKDNYNIFISRVSNNSLISTYDHLFDNTIDEKIKENTLLLISYLEQNQKRSLDHLQKLEFVDNKCFLSMDKESIRNLELVETLRNKDRMFSLLWFMDKTKTAMGSRLLKSFIISPTVEKSIIDRRHDLVELLNNEFLLKSELKELLYNIYDLERLTGKVVCGTLNPRDMVQLKTSLSVLPDINNILESLNEEKLETFTSLYKLLDDAIIDTPPLTIKEGGIIKPGFNSELDELKSIKKGGTDFISKFEAEERERTGIKTLKVGYNKVFGYYIEISKGAIKDVKEEFNYVRKQTLTTGERFITPQLKEKEDLILNAEDKINSLEYDLFNEVKEEIKKVIPMLQSVSNKIAFYDVMQSFSTVAEENHLIRPSINEENVIEIIDGRHPVVEHVIKDEYIPNDVIMNKENVLLITGPNMSGKSTFMRQLAIIVIMNQIGSFVPAKSANLPIFDKIFTRIGASDDLVGGESTFMVEMKESANALRNATKNSLILFDELGRGTSTYDGMALAGAIIKYVSNHIGCKTLFSTHYHELTKMENDKIKNVHVSALEEGDSIKFLHKVQDGSVDKSYGINVAKLALLPREVIEDANSILKDLEKNNKVSIDVNASQLSFDLDNTNKVNSELLDYIDSINPLEVTPIEAIAILDKIKKLNK